MARSTLHLCQIAETLREKSVDLVVLDQNIDTSGGWAVGIGACWWPRRSRAGA
ncbi:hypothetical protein ABMC89_18205 [Sulfitobacter sp. HNIBRBA3233]